MRKVSVYAFMILIVLFTSFLMAGASSRLELSNQRIENAIHVENDGAPAVEWNKTFAGATAVDGRPYILIQTKNGGYAIAGRTDISGFWLIKTDANGSLTLNKTYGSGTILCSLIQTSDSGFALVGVTNDASFPDGDAYIIKTDVDGNVQWNKTHGGPNHDGASYIVETSDGGYLFVGNTMSYSAGWDVWLVKIDASGNLQWSKTYGGSFDDTANQIIQTSDGGYAIFGGTWSFAARLCDWWLIKTDVNGNEQWNKTYDGNGWDDSRAIVQTSDGGFTMFGTTGPGMDFWLVKTDENGNSLWNKTYGGTDAEFGGFGLLQTSDGGYAFVGETNSFGAGGFDFWLVKTDSTGNMQWNQTYGGAGDDVGQSIVQTADKGYAMCGYTNSFSGDGSYQVWLIKLAPTSPITITVPDDYPTIQAAINAASDGDTIFVRNGTYYEHVMVNKTLTLTGEDKNTTIIDGEYKDPPEMQGSVMLVAADNVTISGFTIQHCRGGGNAIAMTSYVNMTFSDNIITGCNEGVRILYSSGNVVSNNNIQGCYYNVGLGFNWVYNSTVYENILANNNIGIGGNFWNNTFFNNIIRDNVGGWAGWGISDNFYDCVFYHNNIINNGHQVHNSNPNPNVWDDGYPSGGNYWSDYSGVDANGDGIGDTPYIIDTNNEDGYPLVHPYGSIVNLNTSLTYLTIQSAIDAPETVNGHTIFVRNGTYSGSVVVNKTLSLTGENAYSTTIDGSSGLVAISVTANDVQISGFRLIYCGIQIDSANRTIISNNLIDKAAVGISLYHSYNNTIVGNTISNCSLLRSSAAFRMQYSNGSIIYHNNFLHDGRPPLNIIESFNKWDDGYPSGGNYWTTYMGVPINSPDLFKGPYQNETGSDGMLDFQYYDDWQGTPIIDNFPLTKPWPWGSHDIGISSVGKGTQKTVVFVGSKVNISVYVMNYGDNSETFSVTTYANTSLINETTDLALASRDSTVLNITWNTSGFSKGNYTISAYAQPVPGEIDTADNNSTAGYIIVSGLGDLTGGTPNSWDFVPDGTVDGSDLIVVARCFGSWPGAPPPMLWNANCDVTSDGFIDGSDLIIIARHFGEASP